ncbi:MAG: hypothetical protein EP336_16420 [Rhodobacteraceae bacterium]|nr:MAG: hypothetical protein EP336_16420 [Paracoccaceae bacterium]
MCDTLPNEHQEHFKKIKKTYTLIGFWSKLHAFFYELETSLRGLLPEEGRITHNIRTLCHSMAQIPADKWSGLCSSIGPTVYGAIALSWCKDAELSQVWEGWHASGFPLKPSPEFERPARFINPALMPVSDSLHDILNAEARKHEDPEIHTLAICARIAAVQGPLKFDIPLDSLKTAPPQIAAFLKSRMLEKPDRTAEESALIATWSATVKGTEFDIWESA